jgi:hypothetical protein
MIDIRKPISTLLEKKKSCRFLQTLKLNAHRMAKKGTTPFLLVYKNLKFGIKFPPHCTPFSQKSSKTSDNKSWSGRPLEPFDADNTHSG